MRSASALLTLCLLAMPDCGLAKEFKISHQWPAEVDDGAEVLDTEDRPIPGLHAAGELVGGLFYENYPGGTGLMAGAVFGRLAGEQAARYVALSR